MLCIRALADQLSGRLVGCHRHCTLMTRHEWLGSELGKQRCFGVRHSEALGLFALLYGKESLRRKG